VQHRIYTRGGRGWWGGQKRRSAKSAGSKKFLLGGKGIKWFKKVLSKHCNLLLTKRTQKAGWAVVVEGGGRVGGSWVERRGRCEDCTNRN